MGQYRIESDTIKNVYDSTYCVEHRNEVYDSGNYILERFSAIKCYYNNGVLKEEFNHTIGKKSNGLFKSYYQNRTLREIYNVIQGRKAGYYLEYHPTGNIKVIGYYEDFNNLNETLGCDTNTYDNTTMGVTVEEVTCRFISIKTGEWIYYDLDGEVDKIEQYEKGKLCGLKR